MDYIQILEKLHNMSDLKYKKFHSGLVPNIDNIIGVRIPDLKKTAKEIAQKDPVSFIQHEPKTTYEEITLEGLVIGYMKCDFQQKISYLRHFIPQITNWATCDYSCANLKDTKKYKAEMLELINECLTSKEEFTLRFAIVMLLDFYVDDQYIDFVLKKMTEIKSEHYYVKMAVAWTLSLCYIKYPDKSREYISNDNLDEFTYKKTLQKIKESKRNPDAINNIKTE